jgi:hypothetical protein
MSILGKTKKAIKDPSRLLYLLPYNEFSGSLENRSESDNGNYLSAVRGALENYSKFSNFKRHPFYRAILEHVSKDQGERYLEIVKKQSPQFLDDATLTGLRKNDDIGNPIKHTYPSGGEISPTTLRYIKVASDIHNLFGDNLGDHVVEIGCGYSGITGRGQSDEPACDAINALSKYRDKLSAIIVDAFREFGHRGVPKKSELVGACEYFLETTSN